MNRAAPTWMLWANPILRRYCRSLLRPQKVAVSLLITFLIAGFLFFFCRNLGIRSGHSTMDAVRWPLIPLLSFQGLILFLRGTGQVAGGMTAEADEGVLDYQRLAPMTPLAKVFGYLFGLPVREWVMFLATMPFTAWCIWRGSVPLDVAAELYVSLVTSAILYHLTGLVAATVVKNRRWAFLISIGAVFVLYTLVPQFAKFGMVYFKYLTLWPVFWESFPHLIPRDPGAIVQTGQALLPTARFFNLDFAEAVFTVLSQGVLILAAIVMLWRRWRRAESHLLGKLGAVALFAWFQILLLGNALPLIDSGRLFPSLAFSNMVAFDFDDWKPDGMEAVTIIGIYGLVTVGLIWIMAFIITPTLDGQIRGWRRARKLGKHSVSPVSDPGTAFPWIGAMVALGAAGWFIFARELVHSRWFPGHEVGAGSLVAFVLVLLAGGFGMHALLECRGKRAVGLAVIFVAILPVMLGTILVAVSDKFVVASCWILGISPGAAPMYASSATLGLADLPIDLARALPRAFWFWQGLGAMVAVRLLLDLRRSRRRIASRTEDKSMPPEAAQG